MKLILTILLFVMMLLPIILLVQEMSNDVRTKQPKKKTYNIRDEMNMLDEAKWIEKVIKSCKTYKQLIAADKLSSILRNKYRNKIDAKLLIDINVKLDLVWTEMIEQVVYS